MSETIEPVAEAMRAIADPLGAEIRSARVLVVDDLLANVTLLTRMLAGAGYTAVTSTLDPTAVVALHAEHRFDLIILDLQMPGMDGFDVMEHLKVLEPDGYLPVLVITAQPQHKLRALRAGARDFISKPFEIAEVLTRVHHMIEVRLLHQTLVRKHAEISSLFSQVVAAKQTAERLALHMPVDSIAARLQARPDVDEDTYPDTTVLVAELTGFSEQGSTVTRAQLLQWRDALFEAFDALGRTHRLRKVKILGNSYLAISGAPRADEQHAATAVAMAHAMGDAVREANARCGATLQLRVGLASGPVVAAVIGKRAYLYDVWGDTVVLAHRIASYGVPGRVQLAASTMARLPNDTVAPSGSLPADATGAPMVWHVVGAD